MSRIGIEIAFDFFQPQRQALPALAELAVHVFQAFPAPSLPCYDSMGCQQISKLLKQSIDSI